MSSIKNKDDLIGSLARQLEEAAKRDKPPVKSNGACGFTHLGNCKAVLGGVNFPGGDDREGQAEGHADRGEYSMGVFTLLCFLANDIYYNEEADWSEADQVRLETY